MQVTVPADLESLLLSVGTLHIMVIGLAHILGGSAWSGRVANAFLRFYRGILAFPFTLTARLLTAIGSAIRGGSGTKKKGK